MATDLLDPLGSSPKRKIGEGPWVVSVSLIAPPTHHPVKCGLGGGSGGGHLVSGGRVSGEGGLPKSSTQGRAGGASECSRGILRPRASFFKNRPQGSFILCLEGDAFPSSSSKKGKVKGEPAVSQWKAPRMHVPLCHQSPEGT